MKIKYKLLLKLIIFTIFFIISFNKVASSEIIKKINVKGNERLSNETIILFSELNINDDIN